MVLIFGGVYQGKLDYALTRLGLTEDDVYLCSEEDTAMPQGRKIICGLDKWILALIRTDMNVEELTGRFIENCENAVVICNDISCGVVPMDADFRKWREAVGRTLGKLAQSADEVVRLFCGIPTHIKPTGSIK